MTGNDWAIERAIEQLLIETEVDEEEIREYEDYAIEAWMEELGFEWDEKQGAWIYVDGVTP